MCALSRAGRGVGARARLSDTLLSPSFLPPPCSRCEAGACSWSESFLDFFFFLPPPFIMRSQRLSAESFDVRLPGGPLSDCCDWTRCSAGAFALSSTPIAARSRARLRSSHCSCFRASSLAAAEDSRLCFARTASMCEIRFSCAPVSFSCTATTNATG